MHDDPKPEPAEAEPDVPGLESPLDGETYFGKSATPEESR
jgi:hypothetical protein